MSEVGSYLPNEATTAVLTQQAVEQSNSIQVFMDSLTSQEKSRFTEIAHHLLYIGFVSGQQRSGVELTDVQKAGILAHKFEIYLLGHNEGRDYEADNLEF